LRLKRNKRKYYEIEAENAKKELNKKKRRHANEIQKNYIVKIFSPIKNIFSVLIKIVIVLMDLMSL